MIKINTTTQNVLIQTLADIFNAGVDTTNIYGGAEPVTANTALSGQPLLAGVTVPRPGLSAPSSGTVSKVGTWEDLSIDAGGTASFFRMVDDTGRIVQGTVTATGGGGDMEVNNINFVQNGEFTITAFSLTMPAA